MEESRQDLGRCMATSRLTQCWLEVDPVEVLVVEVLTMYWTVEVLVVDRQWQVEV